jgi:hypothetical protein
MKLKKMDLELEEQIDELITKSVKDLKTKICRVVLRNQNKLLKDQARDFKNNKGSLTTRASIRKPTLESNDSGRRKTTEHRKSSKKEEKYHSDSNSNSDSEGYYSR